MKLNFRCTEPANKVTWYFRFYSIADWVSLSLSFNRERRYDFAHDSNWTVRMWEINIEKDARE